MIPIYFYVRINTTLKDDGYQNHIHVVLVFLFVLLY